MDHPGSIHARVLRYLKHASRLRSGHVVLDGRSIRGIIDECVGPSRTNNAAWGRFCRRDGVIESEFYSVDIAWALLQELGERISDDDWGKMSALLLDFLQARAADEVVIVELSDDESMRGGADGAMMDQSAVSEPRRPRVGVARTLRRSDRAKRELNNLRQQNRSVEKHKGGKRLRTHSRFAIGVLRRAANVAGWTYGVSQRVDISGPAVARCEVDTWAALLAASKIFHATILQGWAEEPTRDGSPVDVAVVAFMCDATNSSIWQRRKLQGMKVQTRVVVDPLLVQRCSTCKWADAYVEMTRWADAQPVENSKAGGTLALVRKQLGSVGCPLWSDFDSWANSNPDNNALLVMSYSSDGGPDQKKARRQLRR
eukprot:8835009-Pyramimonas_sp.AAC.1